ncbi:MAG: NADH-quinone oxidoreductase subunit I [Firmicutes bacterium]|nr:NADH-quinone oxidoreductase subunit I [Bacillota bacterium]
MNKFLKTLIPFDIAKGLKITGTHFGKVFFSANRRKVPLHVVSEYPEVPVKVQPRFRGRLMMLRDEAGEIKCVCCMSCEKICPTGVISIIAGKQEGRKTRIPERYDFEMERCIFCEFCVESCAFDAIILNHQFELAVYDREDMSLSMEGDFQNMFKTSPVARFSVADEAQ